MVECDDSSGVFEGMDGGVGLLAGLCGVMER